jgi:predicted  nucleic acid-binding Zn-ribbon protein
LNKDQFAYLNEEIKALESERDRLKEELKNVEHMARLDSTRLYEDRDRWKAVAERLAKALKMMGCSELLGCEKPILKNSKHQDNCDWQIAKEALSDFEAIKWKSILT